LWDNYHDDPVPSGTLAGDRLCGARFRQLTESGSSNPVPFPLLPLLGGAVGPGRFCAMSRTTSSDNGQSLYLEGLVDLSAAFVPDAGPCGGTPPYRDPWIGARKQIGVAIGKIAEFCAVKPGRPRLNLRSVGPSRSANPILQAARVAQKIDARSSYLQKHTKRRFP